MLPLPPIAAVALQTARTEPGLLRAQVLTLPAALAVPAAAPFAVPGVVREIGTNGQVRIGTAWGDLQLRLVGEVAVGRDVTVVIRPGARPEALLLPSRPQPGSTMPAPIALPEGSAGPPVVTGPPTIPIAPIGPSAGGKPAASLVPTAAVPTPPAAQAAPGATVLAQATMLAALTTTEVVQAPMPGIVYPGFPVLPAAPELLMVLRDAQRTLAASDPALASALWRRLPAADQAGGVATIMLLAALKRGTVRGLLGKPIEEALGRSGRVDLLEALEAGLARSERQPEAEDGRVWEWRTLPLVDRGTILPMTLGIARDERRDREQGDPSREAPTTCRFAVELSLSAVGRTRVDAAYRAARLDLVVQSEAAFPEDVRERIAAALRPVFGEFGLTGSCRFAALGAATPAVVRI